MKDEFVLREPNRDDKDQVLLYKKEFTDINSYINGSAGLTDIDNFFAWLSKIEDDKKPTSKPVRTELLFVRKTDDKIVGLVNIRHTLCGGFEYDGGHIGYSIRPTERKKGYGTILLSLVLEYCKNIGIKKVLVVCNKNNIASKNVIINNNGKFEKELQIDEQIMERYWIDNE